MEKAVGVCCGASTVSFVKIAKLNNDFKVIDKLIITHNGDPKKIFELNLKSFNNEKLPTVVTGRKFRKLVNLPNISEPEATEYAFKHTINNREEFSAIASLGGETFMVYPLDASGRIATVITKNQCASGTGEFFLQQIKRMNLNIDEAIKIARHTEPHKVSGRCSVFCKSDCTHALNKGTPKAEVASGLALMMADKVEELLAKVHNGKILVIGGVTKNHLVMDFLREKVPDIVIPNEADYFEALGAALFCINNNIEPLKSFDNIFLYSKSSFTFHEPIEKFKDKVTFKSMEKGVAYEGDKCILGLDVGSTTTKAVILRMSDNSILASVYLYTHGNPIEASRKCYKELLNQLKTNIKIVGVGTTGSGRQIAGLHALTENVINEIVAHATSAVYFDSEVDTIFEIGGQDAKYTYIVNKVPADYAMNEACSAGTGSFIEESAFESLGVKVEDIEQIALNGKKPPNFSDQCSAFISSDIKTALQENISKEDIIAGLVYSICLNYVNRVKGNRTVGKKIFMQGGVCYNKAIPIAMSALTGKDIIVPPEPGLMGAFGVALEVKNRIELGISKEKEFSLYELAERNVKYREPFICKGGKEKCDLKCSINLIEVQGKLYPFGGSCNKYYNILYKNKIDTDSFEYVKKRQDLLFKKYAPPNDLPNNAITIGINQSFTTHTIYPLFYNFFTQLGVKVVLSDKIDERGLEKEMTAFCYPAQLSLCLFQNLIEKNPDFFFIPNIIEMPADEEGYQRLDFNCTCVFVNGEPLYLKQAFKNDFPISKLISPTLIFANGFEQEEQKFIEIAKKLGIYDENRVKNAYKYAINMQKNFNEELLSIGKEFLKHLEKHPDDIAIVIVGRPYNSFTELANKGIPQKFASRGIYTIPYDILDFHDEEIDDNMYWEAGKKILKVGKLIKKHPQLFATYITNFSCAPDSMIMTTFRHIMGTKPWLTLELDGHTADAGINTRIDAAIDIIRNYCKIKKNIVDPDFSDFTPAKIEIGDNEGFFITSEGEKLKLTDKKVKILIPSMGDLAAQCFSAAMRSQGFNAIPMPEGNPEILKYGRSVASGKECLPLLLCTGSLLDYLENKWDGKEYIAFFLVQGAGNCRLGQYPVFLREVIRRKKLRNVAVMVLMNEDGFAGLGPDFATRGIQAVIISDVLDDVRSGIMANAKNPEEGLKVFYNEFNKLLDTIESKPKEIYKQLNNFAKEIKNRIPAKRNIKDSKYIALVGEIYVRRDHFSHKWLNKYFAKHGFIVKDSHISEWVFYVDYLLKIGLLEPEASLSKKIERKIREIYMRIAEYKTKKILSHSGYYHFDRIKIPPILKHSEHILPLEHKGEPGLTLGIAIHQSLEKYCGIINVGPFGCMPTRMAEALTVPEMKVQNKIKAKQIHDQSYSLPEIFNGNMNIPFLTIESDGNVYPQVIEARLETFTIQAERVAKLQREWKMNGRAK